MTTILIAEDNWNVASGLESNLIRKGFKVQTAKNGQVALDYLLQGSDVDLFLLDYDMPIKNGGDVLRAIRTDAQYSKYANTPAISIGSFPAGTQGLQEEYPKPASYPMLEAAILKYVQP